jgi:hypothetical protein
MSYGYVVTRARRAHVLIKDSMTESMSESISESMSVYSCETETHRAESGT